jgi:hypothetical protein
MSDVRGHQVTSADFGYHDRVRRFPAGSWSQSVSTSWTVARIAGEPRQPGAQVLPVPVGREIWPRRTSPIFGVVDNNGISTASHHLDWAPGPAGRHDLRQPVGPDSSLPGAPVGPWNGASTTLTTGAGTMSISTDSEFFATFGQPTGCTFFDSPGLEKTPTAPTARCPPTQARRLSRPSASRRPPPPLNGP